MCAIMFSLSFVHLLVCLSVCLYVTKEASSEDFCHGNLIISAIIPINKC